MRRHRRFEQYTSQSAWPCSGTCPTGTKSQNASITNSVCSLRRWRTTPSFHASSQSSMLCSMCARARRSSIKSRKASSRRRQVQHLHQVPTLAHTHHPRSQQRRTPKSARAPLVSLLPWCLLRHPLSHLDRTRASSSRLVAHLRPPRCYSDCASCSLRHRFASKFADGR